MIRSMIIVYYINVLNETSLHIKKTSDLHRYNIVITTQEKRTSKVYCQIVECLKKIVEVWYREQMLPNLARRDISMK